MTITSRDIIKIRQGAYPKDGLRIVFIRALIAVGFLLAVIVAANG